MLNFDLMNRPQPVSATRYWINLQLPCELDNLNMQQLTALRKLIVRAYNSGAKNGRS